MIQNIQLQHQLKKKTVHLKLLHIQIRRMKNGGNAKNVRCTIWLQIDDVIHVVNHEMLVSHPQLNPEAQKLLKNNMVTHHRLVHISRLTIMTVQNQRKKVSVYVE